MRLEPIDPATQEPLDDEERELMDSATWDWSTFGEGRTIGTPCTLIANLLTKLGVGMKRLGGGPRRLPWARRTPYPAVFTGPRTVLRETTGCRHQVVRPRSPHSGSARSGA